MHRERERYALPALIRKAPVLYRGRRRVRVERDKVCFQDKALVRVGGNEAQVDRCSGSKSCSVPDKARIGYQSRAGAFGVVDVVGDGRLRRTGVVPAEYAPARKRDGGDGLRT